MTTRPTTTFSKSIRRCSHRRMAFYQHHHRSSLLILLFLLVVGLLSVPWTTASSSAGGGASQQRQQQPQPTTTTTPRGVITLNSKNFDSSLRDGNLWLIEFYAPWYDTAFSFRCSEV